jgi:hypothetical protein
MRTHFEASRLVVGLVLTFTIAAHQARGQNKDEHAPAWPEHAGCVEETVPIQMRGAISLAKVEVNGKPQRFIVDSAGTTMVNSDRIPIHIVDQLQAGQVTVADTTSLQRWNVVEVSSLRLGNAELRNVKMLSTRLPHLERHFGEEVDGILGADFFVRWEYVVLDYKHKVLRLEPQGCRERQTESPVAHMNPFHRP